ncbi:MAG: aldehyde ferredoxin oxidoreductase, partial [Synergistetes bacterium]|nr:aldehyde ferredoxin oxidoreductase [Synergistota bacterium]MDW8193187.1 aldehyde ferredoxin oxidoreductase N-terminal domain-containing protein [Synergistota bacterium]
MIPPCCPGKILHVDLSKESFWEEDVPQDWYSLYVGGEGFGARYLYDNLKPHIDPLSEENKILFITGPLTDTGAPTSGRTVVMFKSPLTNTIFASNVGGHLAPQIKRCGYDMIVIHGKAKALKYLYVNNDKVEFVDAENLKGLSPKEVQEKIREKHGNRGIQVAAIGESGEKQVRFSAVVVDGHRTAGRGGGGAVMGSKNLKAIAVYGSRFKVSFADSEAFKEMIKKAINEIFEEPFVRDELSKFGTPSFFDAMNLTGLVPFYNWKRSKMPEFNDYLGYKVYHEKLSVKPYACFNCPIACGRHTVISEGKYKGMESGGPEYEALAALGAKTGVKDIYYVTAASHLVNELGLDV